MWLLGWPSIVAEHLHMLLRPLGLADCRLSVLVCMLLAARDPDTVTVVDVRDSVADADALAKNYMSLSYCHI